MGWLALIAVFLFSPIIVVRDQIQRARLRRLVYNSFEYTTHHLVVDDRGVVFDHGRIAVADIVALDAWEITGGGSFTGIESWYLIAITTADARYCLHHETIEPLRPLGIVEHPGLTEGLSGAGGIVYLFTAIWILVVLGLVC